MSAPHTPGPWTWFNYPDGRKLLSAQNRAVVHCPDAPMSVEPADQALIAAAPELLTLTRGAWHLCESLLAVRDGATDESIRAMSAALRAAIAKAEGRS